MRHVEFITSVLYVSANWLTDIFVNLSRAVGVAMNLNLLRLQLTHDNENVEIV